MLSPFSFRGGFSGAFIFKLSRQAVKQRPILSTNQRPIFSTFSAF